MTRLNEMRPAALKAAMTGGMAGWEEWGSATEHTRYAESAPSKRRRICRCGCRQRASHIGMANGIGLMFGCELSVRRWVRSALRVIQGRDGE